MKRLFTPLFSLPLLLALLLSQSAEAQQLPVESYALSRSILQQLIAINTTSAYGTTAAAQAIVARLQSAGYAAEDIQLLAPENHPERANVVVRLHGAQKARPLLYIGHLDVVEAKRADWSMEPFELTENDGWLYGRGTIDMKGQDSVLLASMMTLKQQGFIPDRDIIAAFTADEEQGDANGVAWLLKQHRDLIDAALVINPDGGEADIKNGRKIVLALQTSEKLYMTFSLQATDKGGHSSRPTAQNPIYRLARGLERLSEFHFPVHLTATTQQYFQQAAALEQGQARQDMLAVAKGNPTPSVLRRLSADLDKDLLLRSTCTATMLEGGHAENALPQRAMATIQCRVIPGETPEQIMHTLAQVIHDPAVTVTSLSHITLSPESRITADILTPLQQVVHGLWPEVMVVPQMSPGASDSIYTRAAGMQTFGIDGMFSDIDDDRFHGRDERISVQAFKEELDFTYQLMRRLSAVP